MEESLHYLFITETKQGKSCRKEQKYRQALKKKKSQTKKRAEL